MFKNVIINREAAINAEGGCIVAAGLYRKQARLRRNAGPAMASHREWLRQMAKAQEDAAKELRRAIDAADGDYTPVPESREPFDLNAWNDAHRLFDALYPHTAEAVEPFVREARPLLPTAEQDKRIRIIRSLDGALAA